jgi:hypothetical protein
MCAPMNGAREVRLFEPIELSTSIGSCIEYERCGQRSRLEQYFILAQLSRTHLCVRAHKDMTTLFED